MNRGARPSVGAGRLLAQWIVLIAAALAPAERRSRLREQWLADVHGAGELELSALSVSFGALRTALTPDLIKGHAMKPIGPLAIAMRHIHGTNAWSRALPVALVLGLAVLAGLGLLLQS